jgi:hypothetical protein
MSTISLAGVTIIVGFITVVTGGIGIAMTTAMVDTEEDTSTVTAAMTTRVDSDVFVSSAVEALKSSPVYIDSSASQGIANEAGISAALEGTAVNVVVLPEVAQDTFNANDLARQISQQTGGETIVVIDRATKDSIGVSSSQNQAEIATVINSDLTTDAGEAIYPNISEVVSLASSPAPEATDGAFDPAGGIMGGIVGGLIVLAILGGAAKAVASRRNKRHQDALPVAANRIALTAGKSDEELLIENSITGLRKQIKDRQSDFPERIKLSVNSVLVTLEELLPKWKSMDSYDDQKTNINRIITEYIPNLLNSYLELPKSYLARTKNSTAENSVMEQLDILQQAVNQIQDDVYGGVEANIEQQGLFLAAKFKAAPELRLK